jgi:hypothetical protein
MSVNSCTAYQCIRRHLRTRPTLRVVDITLYAKEHIAGLNAYVSTSLLTLSPQRAHPRSSRPGRFSCTCTTIPSHALIISISTTSTHPVHNRLANLPRCPRLFILVRSRFSLDRQHDPCQTLIEQIQPLLDRRADRDGAY